jgi:hypothetical protein
MFSRQSPVPDLKNRFRPYSLVKYREFDWRMIAPKAPKQMVIGPAASEKATLFTRECLSSFDFKDVEIVQSEIPYRVT